MEETKDNLKKEIINIMIDELVKRNLIKKSNSTYDDTKQLLRNYNKLKYSKKGLRKQINNLEKSKNKIDISNVTAVNIDGEVKGINFKKNLDGINQRISDLEQDIAKIDCFLEFIDNALNNLKSNDDYELLERIYFKNEDPKDIAIDKNCDETTIYRKINRLLNDLKILLFPGKWVDEID